MYNIISIKKHDDIDNCVLLDPFRWQIVPHIYNSSNQWLI